MITHLKLMVLLLLLTHCIQINGHRILGIFIHIGGSHFHTFYPIMNGLAQSGNDVTVLSYFPVTDSDANYKQFIFDGMPVINSSINLNEIDAPSRSIYSIIKEFFDLAEEGELACRAALTSPIIDDILQTHKTNPFDLVITEIFNTECMLGVIHKMNVPYVGLTSCGLMPYHFDRVALPDTPSYIPSIYVGFSNEMGFNDRLVNWLTMKGLKILYRIVERKDNQLLREKFGDGIPDVRDLANNITLLLVNQHFSLSGSRPLSQQVVEIGGIHIKAEREVPPHLKKILDNAVHGVILFSWGSHLNASSIPKNKLASMTSALGRLNQTIIWKWELDVMPNKPSNVFITPWLPQRDILCHPNVILFWSHGGNLGVSESAWCGVPVLTTPFYGDQFLNAAVLKKRRMGETLFYDDLNDDDKIYGALLVMLQPSYTKNAKIISSAFRTRPMAPIETSLWWIQHILANDGELIKSPATNLSWFVYHSVDVMLFLCCMSICAFGTIYGTFVFLARWMKRSKSCKLFDNKKSD